MKLIIRPQVLGQKTPKHLPQCSFCIFNYLKGKYAYSNI